MKICSIHIKGYQQFEDLFLDFTDPETGEPVDKVCFIGRNGTGKSTLLRLINVFLKDFDFLGEFKLIKIKIKLNDQFFYFLRIYIKPIAEERANETRYDCFSTQIDEVEDWERILEEKSINWQSFHEYISFLKEKYQFENERNTYTLSDATNDLHIYSPNESASIELTQLIGRLQSSKSIKDVPNSTLSGALQLFKSFPVYHEVSDENVEAFWEMLIYLIKRRESEKETFENQPYNIDKTKRQLNEEFDTLNPKILDKIAELWNKILNRAGLEFDVEGARVPIQLNDNLHAYIRHKKSKEVIQYSQLSTGIRNFIFRIGHIYSLYFNREIKRGFLLVDEPENSLFPDFLFELMELYDEIIKDKNGDKNTQMFFATHSPIVAAQFEPHERIVLEWDDEGHVTAHKGKSPVGDDPNDILVNDFKLDHLMGEKGQRMWEEYLRLRKELRHTEDLQHKEAILSDLHRIGSTYNFDSKNKYEIPR